MGQLTLGENEIVGADEVVEGVLGEGRDGRVALSDDEGRGRSQKAESLLEMHLSGCVMEKEETKIEGYQELLVAEGGIGKMEWGLGGWEVTEIVREARRRRPFERVGIYFTRGAGAGAERASPERRVQLNRCPLCSSSPRWVTPCGSEGWASVDVPARYLPPLPRRRLPVSYYWRRDLIPAS